jgi:hypothetical protein
LPDILEYKQHVLANENPTCALERIALDLTDIQKRRELFKDLSARTKKGLIVSEGFTGHRLLQLLQLGGTTWV